MELSNLQEFQFAAPVWIWGAGLLPFVWVLYALFYRKGPSDTKLAEFADAHLLPHLLAKDEQKGGQKKRVWLSLVIWSLMWVFGLLAMAGPRWDYTEVKAYAPARSLVILLDLSKSMDAQDIKPSRLARARQEIEDMERLAQGVNIGLIAFASVPHVITPLTDDRGTLSRLLPSLKTDLVFTQGSNLSLALKRAGAMLDSELGKEKHIIVLSDGGFQDGDASIYKAEQELIKRGVRVHIMGMGTEEGAPIPDGKGSYAKQNNTTAISRIEPDKLRSIARDGRGIYLDASYLENDTHALLLQVNRASENEAQKTTRFWEERFYLFLIPLLLLLLPWFRREAAFLVLIFMLLQPAPAQAFEWGDLFLNHNQQGKAAIEQQQYDKAAQKFDDPYRRGVAQYKAEQYEQAMKSFTEAGRADIAADARYNLGNAELMNGKVQEAIDSYKKLLKDHPDHEDASHNLEIAKKMLQGQQQQQNQDQDQDQDQKKDNQQGNQDQKDQQQQNKDEESGKPQDADKKDSQDEQKKDQDKEEQQTDPSKDPQKAEKRTQKDIKADQWLSRIENNPEQFLKNKFYIESMRQNAKQGDNPW